MEFLEQHEGLGMRTKEEDSEDEFHVRDNNNNNNDGEEEEEEEEHHIQHLNLDYNEQELKQIAESLAPQVTSLLDTNEAALEEMLAKDEKDWYIQEQTFNLSHDFKDADPSEDEDEDEDGLDRLRKELEASHDFEFPTFPSTLEYFVLQNSKEDFNVDVNDDHDNIHNHSHESESDENDIETNNGPTAYTLYDHAKYLNLQFDNSDLGYPTCPLLTKHEASKFLDRLEDEERDSVHYTHSNIMTRKERKKMIHTVFNTNQEYIKPMSGEALSRIYEGFDGASNWSQDEVQGTKSNRHKHRSDAKHTVCIKDAQGKYVMGKEEILPVRTMTFQVRPDVLCGAVMDAVYSALVHLDAEITKRQGGHLRALVPGSWVPEPSYSHFRPFGANQGHGITSPMMRPQRMTEGMVFLPSFVIDVQLCLKRSSRTMERVLLTRVFRISPGQILDDGPICPEVPLVPSSDHGTESSSSHGESINITKKNWNLREASSLFQRMRSVAQSGGRLGFDDKDFSDIQEKEDAILSTPNTKSSSTLRNVLTSPLRLFSPSKPKRVNQPKPVLNFVRFDAEESMMEGLDSARSLASQKLVSFFIVTPSVYDDPCDIDPIPSLSYVDWTWIQASWRFITSCLNELESRNLAYR